MLASCYVGFYVGVTETRSSYQLQEQHEDCHDNPKQEAWIARKNGMLRCFMEYKEYPHKSKGSYID